MIENKDKRIDLHSEIFMHPVEVDNPSILESDTVSEIVNQIVKSKTDIRDCSGVVRFEFRGYEPIEDRFKDENELIQVLEQRIIADLNYRLIDCFAISNVDIGFDKYEVYCFPQNYRFGDSMKNCYPAAFFRKVKDEDSKDSD